MIEARHSRWAHALFSPYLHLLLRRHFSAIWLSNPQPELPPQMPVLLLPNHSTWWDGFFVYRLNQTLPGQRRPYVMMLESQLQRFWFFARVGAFSIDPASPAHIRASLRYAAGLLDSTGRREVLLSLFPQGELRPWAQRPLDYKRGLLLLLRMVAQPVCLLPLAITCVFGNARKPDVVLTLGQPQLAGPQTIPDMQDLARETAALLQEQALGHHTGNGIDLLRSAKRRQRQGG